MDRNGTCVFMGENGVYVEAWDITEDGVFAIDIESHATEADRKYAFNYLKIMTASGLQLRNELRAAMQ